MASPSAGYGKRFYSPAAFRAGVREGIEHMDELRVAARGGRISKAFAEKIMLAATRVNGCRYCQYGHSRAALAAGVPPAELEQLLAGDLGQVPEGEAVALAFAQHYAESGCRPDPAASRRMREHYGEAAAGDILAILRMITLGNLSGNTLDAFLSRLQGRPAPNSSVFSELGVLLGAPFVVLGEILRRLIGGSSR